MNPASILVTVANSGTPTQVTADSSVWAVKIAVQQNPANTGRILIGKAGLNKTTLANVLVQLAATGTAVTAVPSYWTVESQDTTNRLRLADYWLDAEVNGESALVAYWTG